MKSFEYLRPQSSAAAATRLQEKGEAAAPLGGGTDLTGLLKNKLAAPERLVDLKAVPGLDTIKETAGGGLAIGATTTVAALAANPLIQQRAPLVAQAAALIASPQIRNVGTVAGNLCQRPRCWYFRNIMTPCLRRDGTYCSAVLGENQFHAILGGSGCFAVHPSDLAPALQAVDAEAVIQGPQAQTVVPLTEFFVLPRQNVRRENILQPGEFLAEVRIPALPESKGAYLKHRVREVWDFAIVSVASRIVRRGDQISDIRLVLGAAAPVPWRCYKAEAVLRGGRPEPAVIQKAIDAELSAARPMSQNEYKIELASALMRHAILESY